jgi:hypothetical protein
MLSRNFRPYWIIFLVLSIYTTSDFPVIFDEQFAIVGVLKYLGDKNKNSNTAPF